MRAGPGDYNHMDPYKAKGLNMFLISFRDPVQTYASNWGVDPCIFGGTNGFQLIKFKTCVRNASSNDRETPPYVHSRILRID